MGTIEINEQGTTGSNSVTINLGDVSSGDSISAAHIQDIADAYSDEITRRGSTPGTYTFTQGTSIANQPLIDLIDDLEAANPPLYDPGYTTNPGTVSAPGSGDNTNVEHAAEVDLTWNVGAYTAGIRANNASLADNAKIFASAINAVASKVENAAAICTCNCNYCTCNCNYCTCNCNYACTCNCNY